MKKYLFVAVLALASVMAYAQPRAIGANIGANFGFSYQHGFGDANMLDVAVFCPWAAGHAYKYGGNTWGIGGIVTYDWIDPFGATVPWNEKGEWHWYMGVGASGGVYNFDVPVWFVGAAGHFGIEYDFWFPMQISIDYRPVIGITGASDVSETIDFDRGGLLAGISLGIRYKF